MSYRRLCLQKKRVVFRQPPWSILTWNSLVGCLGAAPFNVALSGNVCWYSVRPIPTLKGGGGLHNYRSRENTTITQVNIDPACPCLLIETCFPELKHRTAISDQLPAPRTDNLNIFKRNAISCEVILIIYIQLPALCTESLQIYIWKATTCRVIVIIYIQLPLPWTENLNICIWNPG